MTSELIIYQTEDGETKIQTRLEDETVWLTQAQMAELLDKAKSTISEHIKNVFSEGELLKEADGGNYFEELLARIRDIRSSEKVFWRKVLDVYATSIDYCLNH